jgi:hypothetical protein
MDGEWASGKIAYAVGEAALADEPPASEVGRGAAAYVHFLEINRKDGASADSPAI